MDLGATQLCIGPPFPRPWGHILPGTVGKQKIVADFLTDRAPPDVTDLLKKIVKISVKIGSGITMITRGSRQLNIILTSLE